MTPLSAAIEREQYELAALRLLLGALRTLERLEAAAPRARAELIALLTVDDA